MKALTLLVVAVGLFAIGWAINIVTVAVLLNGIGSFDFSFSNLVAFGGIVTLAAGTGYSSGK